MLLNGGAQVQRSSSQDYALFFAANEYPRGIGLSKLKNPIQNAKDIANELEVKYGFKTEIVENPTLEDITSTINTYQQKFRQDIFDRKGQLLIYFSGHGLVRNDKGFFVPVDGKPSSAFKSCLSYDYWRDEINKITCQNILVAIDACYSAYFDPQYKGIRGGPRIFKRKGDLTQVERMVVDNDKYQYRGFFTSDGEGKETPDRSTFAKQILEGLRNPQVLEEFMSASVLFANYLKLADPRPRSGAFGDDEASSNFLFYKRLTPSSKSVTDRTPNRTPEIVTPISKPEERDPPVPFVRPEMIFVQGGTYQMGDQFGDGNENELPVHTVTIDDYYLASSEVTNEEFQVFLMERRNWRGKFFYSGKYYRTPIKRKIKGFEIEEGLEKHPVYGLTFLGAVTYCNWRSEKEGLTPVYTIKNDEITSTNWDANGYRLPTEAEWEFAARERGQKIKWSGTSLEGELGEYCNDATHDDGYPETSPVKKFNPNGMGFYDMSGNVWELCWDDYAYSNTRNYYKESDGSTNPRGPQSSYYGSRVLRGGSYSTKQHSCRVYSRSVSNRINNGLRLAQTY